ncbi:MAG: FeoA family protein [Candidatus Syntropharchaeia archaeon]
MITLAQMNPGERGVVRQVLGGWGQQRHLRSLGIREGKVVRIMTKQPARGPIVVEVDGNQIAIGRGVAMKVLVEVT